LIRRNQVEPGREEKGEAGDLASQSTPLLIEIYFGKVWDRVASVTLRCEMVLLDIFLFFLERNCTCWGS
jgi:hypothetical protein